MRFFAVAAALLAVAVAVALAGCREKPEPKVDVDPCSGPSLVAFGHSYVQGNAPGAPKATWVDRVARELDVCADNRGLAGSQSGHTEQSVTAYKPAEQDVVVVETVINDIFVTGIRGLDAFRMRIDRMLEHLTADGERPKRVAVLIDPPPAKWTGRPNQVEPFVHGSDGTLDQYAQALADVAEEHRGVEVVDLRRGWSTERDVLPDELHPNESGTERIAQAVTRALR